MLIQPKKNENYIKRMEVEKYYNEHENDYYDKKGRVFDLKPLTNNSNETHYVAYKEEVK
ncbi:hypothetical protein [Oceanivirga salmonicida]|nr:hypothetical protein [Oceanivirga salmonicida]